MIRDYINFFFQDPYTPISIHNNAQGFVAAQVMCLDEFVGGFYRHCHLSCLEAQIRQTLRFQKRRICQTEFGLEKNVPSFLGQVIGDKKEKLNLQVSSEKKNLVGWVI